MKYSKKGLEKRKKDREGFKEFFEKHVNKIKQEKLTCEECGDKLKGNVSEIAHCLPKQKFKSIATNDKNVLYLCGMYSNNQCHNKFDNAKTEVVKNMKVYKKAAQRFTELEPKITERISYKEYDKWEI